MRDYDSIPAINVNEVISFGHSIHLGPRKQAPALLTIPVSAYTTAPDQIMPFLTA